ncbi:hypothetical protein FACS1894200_02530 [Spirochaetia bacterium]|nr:hypothetical protein FACS1894200_02530 [Spirochaetia bacterium]
MFKRCSGLLLVLALCPVGAVSAATVSFLVLETGVTANQAAFEIASTWENAVFDVFYGVGHIVSNAPVVRAQSISDKELPGEAVNEFYDAARTGADYFVLVLLDYSGVKLEGPRTRPGAVTLRVFKTRPIQMLGEKRSAPIKAAKANEELALIKKQIQSLSTYIR